MLQVTDAAMTMLDEIDRPEGQVLRLEPTRENKLALVLGEARDGDVVVDRDGHDSLHVQPQVSDMLEGAVLEKVETPQGPSLSIKRG
jgi:hypothetical protein